MCIRVMAFLKELLITKQRTYQNIYIAENKQKKKEKGT